MRTEGFVFPLEMNPDIKRPGPREFVILMALLSSLVALAIDAMLPALPQIGASLGMREANDTQLIVTTLFIGLALGQLVFGPLSDSFGRKPATYLGVTLFITGCLVSIAAQTFDAMLAGRALQGFGAASTRVTTTAIIRDQYHGRAMARIMSLIMMVFILVPAVAPSLGQVILWFAPWRAIFAALLLLAVVSLVWFYLRQPETLPREKRAPFSARHFLASARETLQNRTSAGYMLASGFIFAAFIGYLSTAQQLFAVQYGLGDRFPLYFGSLALAIGGAGFVNSKLVVRFGMQRLCVVSLTCICVLSAGFLFYASQTHGHPPLPHLMAYLLMLFFCCGILFGNFNALALEPLGHIAGIATAVITSAQTFLSVILGSLIADRYAGDVMPLVAGFTVLGLCAFASLAWAEWEKPGPKNAAGITPDQQAPA